ncbi:MAG: porin family protein [Mucilaginibacter sp.]
MRKLILIIALLFTGKLLLAQSVRFGIKGGFNEAFIDGGPLPDGTVGIFRPGFHVGIFKDYALTNKWSIQPALLYIIKGYKVTTDTQIPGPPPSGVQPLHEDGKQTYQYLELPINILYNIKIKNTKIFVGGGPYMGYLFTAVGQRNTSVNNGAPVFTEIKREVGGSGTFKRIDLGVGMLIGVAIKNGLLLSYGFSNGFTNIIANQGTNPTPMTKNRVMTFSLGYAF